MGAWCLICFALPFAVISQEIVIDSAVDNDLEANAFLPRIQLTVSQTGGHDFLVVVYDTNDSLLALSGSELHVAAVSYPLSGSVIVVPSKSIPIDTYTHIKAFSYNRTDGTSGVSSEIARFVITDRIDDTESSIAGTVEASFDQAGLDPESRAIVCFLTASTEVPDSNSNCVINDTVAALCGASSICTISEVCQQIDPRDTPYLTAWLQSPLEPLDAIAETPAGGKLGPPLVTPLYDSIADHDYLGDITDQTGRTIRPTIQANDLDLTFSWQSLPPASASVGLQSEIYFGTPQLITSRILSANTQLSGACQLLADPGELYTLSIVLDSVAGCGVTLTGEGFMGELTQVISDTSADKVVTAFSFPVAVTIDAITTAELEVTESRFVHLGTLTVETVLGSELRLYAPGFFTPTTAREFLVGDLLYIEHVTRSNRYSLHLTRVFFGNADGSEALLEVDPAILPNSDIPDQLGRFRFVLQIGLIPNCFRGCWLHCESEIYVSAKSLGEGGKGLERASVSMSVFSGRE